MSQLIILLKQLVCRCVKRNSRLLTAGEEDLLAAALFQNVVQMAATTQHSVTHPAVFAGVQTNMEMNYRVQDQEEDQLAVQLVSE